MEGYRQKFVCDRCSSVHWYRPSNGCQNCGKLILKKVLVMPEQEKVEIDSKLRLEIDKLRLDDEWVGQPLQVYTWSKKAADAQHELDSAKADMELTYAETDKSVRDTPGDYGIEKLTNEVVTQTVLADSGYQATVKKVNKAKHNLGLIQAVVNALEHRKRALSMLVDLYTKDYYADHYKRQMSEDINDSDKQSIRSRGARRIADQEEREEAKAEDKNGD